MGFSALPSTHDPKHRKWQNNHNAPADFNVDHEHLRISAPTSDTDAHRYMRNLANVQAALTPAPITVPPAIHQACFLMRSTMTAETLIGKTVYSTSGHSVRTGPGTIQHLVPEAAADFYAQQADPISAFYASMATACVTQKVPRIRLGSHETKQTRMVAKAVEAATLVAMQYLSNYETDSPYILNNPDYEATAAQKAWDIIRNLTAPEHTKPTDPSHFTRATTEDSDHNMIDQYLDWLRDDADECTEWGDLTIQYPHLDDSLPRKLRTSRGTRLTDAGSLIRRPDRILTDGKLFATKRRYKQRIGSLLIDASGSMSLSHEDILAIMTECPAVTIATYSGAGEEGELWIVGKNGRYSSRALKPPMGGNIVDGPALSWLATQKEPRVWVSDALVTGQGDRTSITLLTDALARQRKARITRYQNLRALVADIADAK